MAVINITEYDGWQDGVVEAKVAEAGVWLWAGFKESLIQIKNETNVIDTLQQEFRSQHPHASAVIALILIVVGAGLILPAVMAGILGVVGFGAGGVVAGSIAAVLQSVIYGGVTTGLFSIFQALGATMGVAPFLFPLFIGLGIVAAGIWFCWTS